MTNSSTRIPRCEVVGPYEAIFADNPDLPAFGARVLGLFLRMRLTLTYLRHNPCQELLAELYGVSQPTASRVIAAYTPPIAAVGGGWGCGCGCGGFAVGDGCGWAVSVISGDGGDFVLGGCRGLDGFFFGR